MEQMVSKELQLKEKKKVALSSLLAAIGLVASKALHRGEKVVDIQVVKDFLTDAVCSTNALDNTGGIPGDINVNNGAGAVQVKPF